jgi:ABC-type multidrug transport system permease subunit
MHRLGIGAAWVWGRLRRIELGRHRVATAIGISAALILISSIVEALATAIFYGSLIVAVAYVILGFIQKNRGAA